MPAIDRHVHLEGNLDPAYVRARAEDSGRAVPEALEALWAGRPVPFEGFIQAFLFGSRFLDSEEAVAQAVAGAARRSLEAPGEGPAGFDLWVSPHFLVKMMGVISLRNLWRGLERGLAEARGQGVAGCVVVDAVNSLGPSHGHEVLDLVLPERPDFVVGFSTGGQESVSFLEWAPVFQRARAAGLRLACHAGESGPGSNVYDAIRFCGVERVVHGTRIFEEPEALELLVDRRIPLDVCLTSNLGLQIVPDLASHPLPRLLEAGVRCALGTDDPGVMPCGLDTEQARAREAGLSEAQMGLLARHASEDAWCLQIKS